MILDLESYMQSYTIWSKNKVKIYMLYKIQNVYHLCVHSEKWHTLANCKGNPGMEMIWGTGTSNEPVAPQTAKSIEYCWNIVENVAVKLSIAKNGFLTRVGDLFHVGIIKGEQESEA